MRKKKKRQTSRLKRNLFPLLGTRGFHASFHPGRLFPEEKVSPTAGEGGSISPNIGSEKFKAQHNQRAVDRKASPKREVRVKEESVQKMRTEKREITDCEKAPGRGECP